MSDTVIVRLPGPPRGKGRHRARVVQMGGKAAVRTHSDAKTVAYEGALRLAASAAMRGRLPLQGAVSVAIFAFLPIPASWSKKKQAAARDRTLRPTSKPDWDNLAKCTDALNGIVWHDDAAVVDGVVRKFYAERPELVIQVTALTAQEVAAA